MFCRLVDHSMARGHYKVALRHLLMMEAEGMALSDLQRPWRDAAIARCAPEQLATIRLQVLQWAEMVRPPPAEPARIQTRWIRRRESPDQATSGNCPISLSRVIG
jgi:hypothetical protein